MLPWRQPLFSLVLSVSILAVGGKGFILLLFSLQNVLFIVSLVSALDFPCSILHSGLMTSVHVFYIHQIYLSFDKTWLHGSYFFYLFIFSNKSRLTDPNHPKPRLHIIAELICRHNSTSLLKTRGSLDLRCGARRCRLVGAE